MQASKARQAPTCAHLEYVKCRGKLQSGFVYLVGSKGQEATKKCISIVKDNVDNITWAEVQKDAKA